MRDAYRRPAWRIGASAWTLDGLQRTFTQRRVDGDMLVGGTGHHVALRADGDVVVDLGVNPAGAHQAETFADQVTANRSLGHDPAIAVPGDTIGNTAAQDGQMALAQRHR